jgi:predicted RNase H-like nuclease (RuvC/YqgF family)
MNQHDSTQNPPQSQALSIPNNPQEATGAGNTNNISNVLSHMQKLEEHNKSLEQRLKEADTRIETLSAEKRAGMKSALDTFIKNWVNANEADENVKQNFFTGVESLANKADENNGVWKMMVAASNLHARQEHDLDTLRTENLDLKQRVDGIYGSSEARTGEKRQRVEGMAPGAESSEYGKKSSQDGIWTDFAASMAQF